MAYYDQGYKVDAGYLPRIDTKNYLLSGMKSGQNLQKGALEMQTTRNKAEQAAKQQAFLAKNLPTNLQGAALSGMGVEDIAKYQGVLGKQEDMKATVTDQERLAHAQGAYNVKAARDKQAAYSRYRQDMISAGYETPEEMPEQYSPDMEDALDELIRGGMKFEDVAKPTDPMSTIGKIQADINAGKISPEMGKQAIEKAVTPSGMAIDIDPETGAISFRQGTGAGLSKRPEGALQTEIVNNEQARDQIKTLRTMYEPEFLTYGGQLEGATATFLNKMDPENRSKFQARRAAFISNANKSFLTFRKWATGVAGGEKEMAEIKRATFSEDDSPQDFEAKLAAADTLYRRLNARSRAALKVGLDPVQNQKAFREYLKANPLDNIPSLQERGDTLSQLGYSKEQVVNMLIDEGYIEPGGNR